MSSVHDLPMADGRVQRAFRTLNRSHVLYVNGFLPLTDLCCFLLAAALAARLAPGWLADTTLQTHGYLSVIAAVLGAILLYDRRFGPLASRGKDRALLRYYLIGFAKFAGCVLIIGAISRTLETIPYTVTTAWLLLSLVSTGLVRVLLASNVRRLTRSGVLTEVIAIVGAGPLAERLIRHLRRTRPVSVDLLGVFDDATRHPTHGTVAGTIDALIELGKTQHIDWIFLTLPASDEQQLLSVVNRLKSLSVNVAICPRNVGMQTPYYMIDYVGDDMPVSLLVDRPQRRWWSPRGVGRFLPRWITTLLLMPALLLTLIRQRRSLKLHQDASEVSPLACGLDHYDLESFVEVAQQFGQRQYGYVVTPNVDHLIRLHEDESFRSLYDHARYVLLDSRFLAQVLRLTRGVQLPVCPGSDLTLQLFERVIESDDRVVVIGGSEQQIRQLTQRYSLHEVAHFNPPRGFINDPAAVETCLQFIEAHSPFRFCLLAVGSPQQEILAQRLQARGIARGLTFCVGASIDFMTGAERRAPRWMQACALEWLHRLLQNPARMATRYLVRGPRVFGLLRKTSFVSRPQPELNAQIKEAA
jgi:exopolysaccharide biosynthesis WecB/TagA/CpsF family protein